MKLRLLSIALLGSVALVSTTVNAQLVRIDGDSTIHPLSRAVAESFQHLMQGSIKVSLAISGTGGGFKKFCQGEIDINGATRPIVKVELAACKSSGVRFVELPVAYDVLVVLINPRNDWVKALTVFELKRIWEPAAQQRITLWSQVRASWPNRPLRLFAPEEDSGSFDYFTEAIVGKARLSRRDVRTAADASLLVRHIANERDALGYLRYARYMEEQLSLRAVPIDNGSGPVAPAPEFVANGTYQPLSRPLFLYVNDRSLDRLDAKQFAAFYLLKAVQFARQAKYLPLTQHTHRTAIDRLKDRKIGTVFGGKAEIPQKLDTIFAREPSY